MALTPAEPELDLDPFIKTERMSSTGFSDRLARIEQTSAASGANELHRTSITPPQPAAVPRHTNLPGRGRQ